MKIRTRDFLVVLAASVAAYWTGRLTAEVEVVVSPAVVVEAAPADDIGACPACPAWVPCADCPACPGPLALHHKTVEARCDVRVADAYVRGLEEARDLAASCDEVLEAVAKCDAEECRDLTWAVDFSLMDVGLQTIQLDLEASNWSACCQELIRHWPEPEGPYGQYPASFPSYCQ